MLFALLLTAALAAHAPSVDEVFGFQELQLEEVPPEPVQAVPDPLNSRENVERAYVEDVQLGKRRLKVYVVLYKGLVESIALEPVDSGDLSDLMVDLEHLYGKPTRRVALQTVWEGKKAHLTWTQLYGAVVITLTSRKLERELKAQP